MDLIAITVLCISFSVLLTPCASLQLQVHSSLGQAASVEPQQLSAPGVLLPRKLKLFEEVKVQRHEAQDSSTVNNKQREGSISGKGYKNEQNVVHGSIGTRQEWMESSDTTQYFTMDYSHVRRRRPIHNKSLRP